MKPDDPCPDGQNVWCKHHCSIIHEPVCKAGVDRATVRDESSRPWHYPCTNFATNTCPKREWPTVAEQADKDRKASEHIAEIIARINDKRCPHCNVKWSGKRQVGRCVYLEPCGHRLGQGRT